MGDGKGFIHKIILDLDIEPRGLIECNVKAEVLYNA